MPDGLFPGGSHQTFGKQIYGEIMKAIIGTLIISTLLLGCTTPSQNHSEPIKKEVISITYLVDNEVRSAGPINDHKCFIYLGDDWSIISLESETTAEKTYVRTKDIINYGTIEIK